MPTAPGGAALGAREGASMRPGGAPFQSQGGVPREEVTLGGDKAAQSRAGAPALAT